MIVALPVTPRAAGWALLCTCLLVYAVSFAWFYPPLAGVEDESGFINQAFIWSKGALSAEGAGFERFPDFVPVPDRGHLSWRNPGRSLTLLPLVAAHQDQLLFVTGALIHVATVVVAALMLGAAGASPLWAVLILCHPTLALYSRTLMADELGGLLLLCAVATAVAARGRAWVVGLALGLAVVARYQAVVAVPFVLLVMMRERGARSALSAAAAAGAIAVALVAYNLSLYGRPVGAMGMTVGNFTVGAPSSALFSLGNVWTQLPFYATALMVLWPLQLLALASEVGPVRRYACAVCLPVLGLVLCYFYRDTGSGFLQDLVLGQRLLQLALPVWVVCYALALQKLVSNARARWPRFFTGSAARGVAVVACVALLAGQTIVFERHQERLLGLLHAREIIADQVPRGSLILGNQVLHKLFWTYPACTWFHWQEIGAVREEVSCRPDAPVPAGARYVAFLAKNPGDGVPAAVQALVSGPSATRLPTPDGDLLLYRIGF